MKILNVHHSVNPVYGGPLEATRQLGTMLRSMGHGVEWASMDASGDAWARDFPLPLHALGNRLNGYGFAPRFPAWMRENRGKYDVVVVHGLWQFQGWAVHRALRGGGTPYFVMCHGMLDPWFKTAYPLKHLKKSIYWRLIEHRVLSDARGVIFTCEEEMRMARRTFSPYRIVREKIATLGTSLPPGNSEDWRAEFFEKFPDLRNKRLLLFLGRLHPKKGCDLLLEALARTGGPLHLVVAGPEDDPAHVRQLRRRAEQMPVTFTGMLSGGIKWGALAAAEAFILPSHQENFGMVVAEALAVGTPVLISNKVNIWREIEEDGAGFVEPDNLEGTTRLIEHWLGADQGKLRAAARNCFSARFDIRKAAENMLAVLQS